jgi:hypothetical protein
MVNNIYGARYPDGCGAIKKDTYEGYFREVNLLCHILFKEAKADVVVCAGDGIFPDPEMHATSAGALFATRFPSGVGVMQPQWDKHEGQCWAPWIGRGFWNQFYNGEGPFCHEYMQMFGGHELYDVAAREGVLYETDAYHQIDCKLPRDWQGDHNFKEYHDKDRSMYFYRKREKFPGSGNLGKLYVPEHSGKIILPSEL